MKQTKPYRHIETLLTLHFHGLAERRQATLDDLREIRRRIDEIDRLITSGDLIPSVGVAAYKAPEGHSSNVSDPTANAAATYAAEVRRLSGELSRLRASEQTYAGELFEMEQLQRHLTAALGMLTEDYKDVIAKRYHDKRTITAIAIDQTCDEGTIRYHLSYALRCIDGFLAPRLTPRSLPFLFQYMPEIFPQTFRENPCFRRELVLQ